jgi:hypothetical protein
MLTITPPMQSNIELYDKRCTYTTMICPLEMIFRRVCGKAPPAPRPNFSALCLGLANSGKSTLLALLSGENAEGLRPTVGQYLLCQFVHVRLSFYMHLL